MRTVADCIHALRRASGTNSFVALDRPVRDDVLTHLQRLMAMDVTKSQRVPATVREARLALKVKHQRANLRRINIEREQRFPLTLRRMYTQLLQKREKELREIRSSRSFWHRALDHLNIRP